jgi:hypothetical protein
MIEEPFSLEMVNEALVAFDRADKDKKKPIRLIVISRERWLIQHGKTQMEIEMYRTKGKLSGLSVLVDKNPDAPLVRVE